MAGLLNWWDGAELWLTGRGFLVQTVIIMPVVLALAYGIAATLDAVLANGIALARRVRAGRAPRR